MGQRVPGSSEVRAEATGETSSSTDSSIPPVWPGVSAAEKYAELETRGLRRPKCDCHGELLLWSKDKGCFAGGHWTCAMRKRLSSKTSRANDESYNEKQRTRYKESEGRKYFQKYRSTPEGRRSAQKAHRRYAENFFLKHGKTRSAAYYENMTQFQIDKKNLRNRRREALKRMKQRHQTVGGD